MFITETKRFIHIIWQQTDVAEMILNFHQSFTNLKKSSSDFTIHCGKQSFKVHKVILLIHCIHVQVPLSCIICHTG